VAPACETPSMPAGSSGEESAPSQPSDMRAAHDTLSTPAGSSSIPAEPAGRQCAPLPTVDVAAAAVPQGDAAGQPPAVDNALDDLEQLMQLLGVGTSSSTGSSDGWGEVDGVRPAAGHEPPGPPATRPHSCPTAWPAV
jgi:hypothetical protein